MAVERPTFSESWYRVADLRPRLRSTVQAHRQHFRGQLWQVLQDPAGSEFFRLSAPAYHFVGMLDGHRTVGEVWRACTEQLGDSAPTQGEAIQLLGQLYVSNLLSCELPPDAEGLFRRYRRRRVREVQSYLMSLLFLRIPLIDPDRFLDRWIALVGWLYSWFGLALWLALMATGVYFVIGRVGDLTEPFQRLLDPANLPWLYVAIVITKVFHEFSHAFACKKFGRQAGGRGEVHVMGVMFLVFVPLPYMDASSAWAFRSKWQRAMVGAAGMFAELAVAAVAAVVWAHASPGAVQAICYNMMFVASISSLLFNGNPLLRFDGYYILSDLLEIPNLAQRSREQLQYLVKRYVYGVRRLRSPAHSRGERAWFVVYGPASAVYRVFIFAVILLHLSNRLPDPLAFVAMAFGAAAAFAWICVPAWKFLRYLTTSPELDRVRSRAVTISAAVALAVVVGVGLVPVPDRSRVEGIFEPEWMAVVYARADGFVTGYCPTGRQVAPDGPVLLQCTNVELQSRHDRLEARRRELEARRRLASTAEPAAVQVLDRHLAAVDEQIRWAAEELAALNLRAPRACTWLARDVDRLLHSHVRRGDAIGIVADLERLTIRVVAGQDDTAAFLAEIGQQVELRLAGRPEAHMTGRVIDVFRTGSRQLPSAALGYAAGGRLEIDPRDPKGTRTTEPFRTILVAPDAGGELRPGQRVVARFALPPKPLAAQAWRGLLRLLQRRFHV